MAVLYIVLGILALILCLSLFTNMTLLITVQKKHGDELKTEVSLSVLGKPVDILPFIKKNGRKKDKTEKNANNKNDKTRRSNRGEKLGSFIKNLAKGRYTYLLSKRCIKKKIRVETFDFRLKFGLDDAAHTGIAVGTAWGGLYNIFALVDKLFTVKNHNFEITPVFDGEYLDMDFKTKIRFSISNIISLAVVIFVNYMKSEKIYK